MVFFTFALIFLVLLQFATCSDWVGFLVNKNMKKSQLSCIGPVMTIGAEGFGFDSRVRQIGHNVANGSPPL